MKARIVYNGREYASAEAMPANVRREFEGVMAHLADADRNGIPDMMERGEHRGREGARSTISIEHSSITFDGCTLSSSGGMPAFVRRLLEESIARMQPNRDDGQASGDETARRDPDLLSPDTPLGAMGRSLFDGADHRDRADQRQRVVASLDWVSHGLALFLGALLGVAALVVLVVAVAMIMTMDESSRSQGGRIYVAIVAMVVLGALDSQAAFLVKRRWGTPGLVGTSAESRRFALFSIVFLVLAAALLLGLAVLLP